MPSCSFLPLAVSGLTAIVCFLMLQEFILGKKVPFLFFFSFLNALGNVIQQECSQELLMAERRMGMPSSRPCARPPGTGSLGCGSPGCSVPAPQLCPMLPGKRGQPSPTAAPAHAMPPLGTMAAEAEGRRQEPGEGQAVR